MSFVFIKKFEKKIPENDSVRGNHATYPGFEGGQIIKTFLNHLLNICVRTNIILIDQVKLYVLIIFFI